MENDLTEFERLQKHCLLSNHERAMENDPTSELRRWLTHHLTEIERLQKQSLLSNHQRAMENEPTSELRRWLTHHPTSELLRWLTHHLLSNHQRAMENDPKSELRRWLTHHLTEFERLQKHSFLSNHQSAMEEYAIHDVAASDEKMIVGSQEVHSNYRRSCHGTKLMKSALILALIFWPCAGETGHGSGQPEHKGHSEIFQSTLHIVSSCPSPKEYMQKSIAKCVDVCGSYMQDGNCAYHCMRDSSKTKLVEFCAKPEILFEYCPEYDPVDQTIQKDTATLCNSKFSRNYYNSSDIYFCDPDNCLQLHESSVRSGATTLTTLMNETTEMDGGDSQEWYIPLLIGAAALIVAILLGCILWVFTKRKRFPGNPSCTRKMRKERNRDGTQYLYHKRITQV